MSTETSRPIISTLISGGIPSGVHDAIAAIVQRAKIDKAGVYWQLGTAYRAGNTDTLATSLGYGTPGVLLTLLEYHCRTGDADTAELLLKGLAWVRHRARSGAFAHGFYGGSVGLWYLYRQFDRCFPGSAGNWHSAAVASLRQASHDCSAGIGVGAAGTMIGILSCLDLPHDDVREVIRPLCDRILAFAGLAETGLFWDTNVTSVRPPLGFLFGNAGIEYALAHSSAALGEQYSAVLLGSLARARAAFDDRKGNWPDFDLASDLRDTEPAAIERILDRIDKREATPDSPEYSLGWASGTAGVVLGRSALAAAFPDTLVGKLAEIDKARAVNTLVTAKPVEWDTMDVSLQDGLAGVAVACRAAAERDASAREALIQCASRCEGRLIARDPIIRNDDVSLLSGLAGHAYALLVRDSRTCADPLRPRISPVSPSAPEVDLSSILTLRMPNCARMARGIKSVDRPITFGMVRELVLASQPQDASDVTRRCCERELGLQQALSDTNFRRRFWSELAAQRRFIRHYGEGMDENVLFGRFAIDPSVTLFDLEVDPSTRASTPVGQPLHVLRQPGSKGVIEARLTPLQAALLGEFGAGALTLKVIHDVIDRVQTPNVTQRQLAALALKMVRGFIQGGQLVPMDAGYVERWLTRRKFRDVRNNLFPALLA